MPSTRRRLTSDELELLLQEDAVLCRGMFASRFFNGAPFPCKIVPKQIQSDGTENMVIQQQLQIETRGRNTYNITRQVTQAVEASGISTGLCQLFICHTSASLILCENADPSVRSDLEGFMSRLVPDGDRQFQHTQEGPDDMAAHIRAILTKMDLSFPVTHGRAALGTWQGIYLWEHRTHPHRRQVTLTLYGE